MSGDPVPGGEQSETSDWEPVEPQTLIQSLKCAVCWEYFTRPHTIPCGHTFCTRCLQTLARLTRASRNRPIDHLRFRCPSCRKNTLARPILRRKASVNYSMKELIDEWFASPYASGTVENITMRSIGSQTNTSTETSQPNDSKTTDTSAETSQPNDSKTTDTSAETSQPNDSKTTDTSADPSQPNNSKTTDTSAETSQPNDSKTTDTSAETSQPNDSKTTDTSTKTSQPNDSKTTDTSAETSQPNDSKITDTSEEIGKSNDSKRKLDPIEEKPNEDGDICDNISEVEYREVLFHRIDAKPSSGKAPQKEAMDLTTTSIDDLNPDETNASSSDDSESEPEIRMLFGNLQVVNDQRNQRTLRFDVTMASVLLSLFMTQCRHMFIAISQSRSRTLLTIFWFVYGGFIVCISRSFLPWMTFYTIIYFIIIYAEMTPDHVPQ